ncbi:endonuclease/exonuclease/phosphatase family protein [Kaistella montana]|uniref:Endonuclease/exonuclease/phosphatase family protein n=1 Tax=Kaistella montana TaxID=1849733 RepID=A0ABW5KDD8_9FLAO|nr:endonuclease/exonuclease/phosphatase family protein [Kaistella montana]MCQ4035877.1 endonuclease/exonuclease/phosphatase family protein [Kaistella montana]
MKLFRLLLTIFHLGILMLLLGTALNAYVPPRVFPWLNMISLLFPILMILNVLFCLFWTILWKKRAIFFFAFSLFLIVPTSRWINYREKKSIKPNLKMITFNIKGGRVGGKEKVFNYLKNSGADVILLQEYGSEYQVSGYDYSVGKYEIVALNSKTKILDQGKIATSGNGNSFFADIEINGKRIRFINLYLSPFSFEKQKVKPSEDLDQNEYKLRYILGKLVPTFKNHQTEVQELQNAVSASPYPVILAGDFNAVPNSYEYYHLIKNLKDAFVEVGRGSATSFHDYKFPIRIDHVFCSESIQPVAYRVDRSEKLSDHFPVITEFYID